MDKTSRAEPQRATEPPAAGSTREQQAPIAALHGSVGNAAVAAMLTGTQDETAIARAGKRDPAQPLPYRSELEHQLGTNLGDVQTHAGPNAQAASEQLGAHAFTVDQAIVFGDAAPSKELVAHEVIHVLQARGDGSGTQGEDESEADSVGARLARGEHVDAGQVRGSGRGVRKKEKSLVERFLVFHQGLEEKHESATVEDAPGGDVVIEHESSESKVGGHGYKLEYEHTIDTGTAPLTPAQLRARRAAIADQRARMETTISDAKAQVSNQLALAYVASVALEGKIALLDRQVENFAELDDALVLDAKLQAMNKAAQLREKAANLEKDIEHHKKLIAALDDGLTNLAKQDPLEVADAVALAEQDFKSKVKVTTKKSFGLDPFRRKLTSERTTTETVTDGEGGEVETTSSQATELHISEGIGGSTTVKNSKRSERPDGSVHESETSATASARVIAKNDGSVGAGGKIGLSQALGNQYGKVMAEPAFGGSVTVNIVPVPRASDTAPELFAVVVTIDVSAALELGAEKSKKGKKKGDKHGAKATIGGSFEGQLTHTHVLDAEATRSYLDDLEKAGKGNSSAARHSPELMVLHKALNGLDSIDDVANATIATVGSADAAAHLGVDESVELTLDAGWQVGASLEGKRGDTEAGASAGYEQKLTRSLKIARVAGQPGQQLVDVTIAFGDSQAMHGELTASALGATVSGGKSAEKSKSQTVSFRLDAGEPDYTSLYETIVAATSPSELEAIRKSPALRKHVQSYTAKTEEKGGSKGGIKSDYLGVSWQDSYRRSSLRGRDEDGDFAEEEGEHQSGIAFSFGPLDVLRHQQTDTAAFDHHGSVSTLDLSEQTTDAQVGQFELPSLQNLITDGSLKDTAENALLKSRKLLAGYLLDPIDLAALARRAKYEDAWSKVPLAADTGRSDENAAAWVTLGRELQKPRLDDDFSIDQIELAREVARGKAIADFMKTCSRAKGVEYLQFVLRRWGEVTHVAEEDLGVAYEFPSGVSRDRYLDVRFRARDLERKLSGIGPDLEQGKAYCAELEVDMAKMIAKLEVAHFEREHCRVEMIGELRDLAVSVKRTSRDFERACTGTEVTLEQAHQDEIEDAKLRVHHEEETLMQSKRAEIALLTRAKLARRMESGLDLVDALEPIVGISDCELEKVYRRHRVLVERLRASYKAAGVPQSVWLVADRGGEARVLDIDFSGALTALWAYHTALPMMEGGYESRKDRWYAKYWNY